MTPGSGARVDNGVPGTAVVVTAEIAVLTVLGTLRVATPLLGGPIRAEPAGAVSAAPGCGPLAVPLAAVRAGDCVDLADTPDAGRLPTAPLGRTAPAVVGEAPEPMLGPTVPEE